MSLLFWRNEEAPPPSRRQDRLRFDLHGAVIRGANMGGFLLEEANLQGTDAANVSFRGADFKNANLQGTILKGADLTDARNLTAAQLEEAVIDETTKLSPELAAELRARLEPQPSEP